MAMADLARKGTGRPETLALIAQRQEISLAYLEQLFAKLRRAGLVAATRGPGGGYSLAKAPTEVKIADIVLAVNEPLKATRCEAQSEKGCLGRTGKCLTHELWDELGTQIHLFLDSVTLADVLERKVKGRARPAAPARRTEFELAE
jgi:Rrf2 family iron-sulfur cluster assembly transcriptional regulator